MIKVKRALISVSDKSGIIELAKGLSKLGVEILSTGGTAKLIRNADIPVKDVSEYTGFPEMLDGRVKTLHPKIHGGLLALRDNPEHVSQIKQHNIEPIDMVVINLYPFEKVIRKSKVQIEEAIENIDIGGPSMLRSAAKNYRSVAVISDPSRYREILNELDNNNGMLSDALLRDLAIDTFTLTSHYDGIIYDFLKSRLKKAQLAKEDNSESANLTFNKVQDLRYGENPHQEAAFYANAKKLSGLPLAKQLHGKELSFNNILDLDAAVNIVRDFKNPTAVVIKHTNPCGLAEAKTLHQAFKDAWDCDSLSAFGSIVGLNRKVDVKTATAISKAGFVECVVAPAYDTKALTVLKKKKNVRILKLDLNKFNVEPDIKKVAGGILIQDSDKKEVTLKDLKIATKKKPSKAQLKSLMFAWKVVKHVKSNAIVLVQGTKTVGIGPGQTSRVDATIISIRKAGKRTKGAVLASDAFFPKEDAVQQMAKAKIKAVIQPGGSIGDEQIIKRANKASISMVFTGTRHFKH